jgi:UDP-glucose 4-epimerase
MPRTTVPAIHSPGVTGASLSGWGDRRFAVIGGAGFIGSHFVHSLLADPAVESVTVYDNFSSGSEMHLKDVRDDARLLVVRGDVRDLENLKPAIEGSETVIHLASNPDIAKAATDPTVDFWEGTYLTLNVVEAMRLTNVRRILYASGSGVYGDLGYEAAHEDLGPRAPVSTYGASKLAGEALLSSYCHMFGFRARAFRFANVVGPRQTHGIGFDFVRRLAADPTRLRVLGDGTQSKSYIHVSDVIEAVRAAHCHEGSAFEVYNVATGDYITVNEIAQLAIEVMGLDPRLVTATYTGGDRGWKGDVPIVRLNSGRIRDLGWANSWNSGEALERSMRAMVAEVLSEGVGAVTL